MTTTTTLTGHDAIAHAVRTGAKIHKHADPIDGAREVTLDEARAIAAEDAGRVWCEAPAISVGSRVAFDGANGCEDGTVLAVEDSGAGDVAIVRWWPSGRVGTVGVDELHAH